MKFSGLIDIDGDKHPFCNHSGDVAMVTSLIRSDLAGSCWALPHIF